MNADPFTGNRDAFGGGNPISNVEVDGHFFNITGIVKMAELLGPGRSPECHRHDAGST
ncbi:hypothetical protein [Micromonospora sp. NPDC005113]